MTNEPTPGQVASTDLLGLGAEPGALVRRLRNLAFSVTLPMSQQARDDMIAAVAEIERLNFQRQILQSESDRLRSRNARLRVEITSDLIAQGWTAPKADDNEADRLRALLLRQYRADAACYALPNDCTEAEHIAVLSEHDAVHALLAREVLT